MYDMNGKYRSGKSDNTEKTSKVFEAKWKGTCPVCSMSWERGDRLMYKKGKLIHAKCPEPKIIDAIAMDGNEIVPAKRTKKNAMSILKGKFVPVAVMEESAIPEAITNKLFVPSVYQQAAFDWAVKGKGNAVMSAVAGSGKTTTIVKMLEILPRDLNILFVAFNKKIVKALEDKIRALGFNNITIRTLNSAGFAVIRKYKGFKEMQKTKVMDIMNDFWPISRNEVEDAKTRNENRVKRRSMDTLVSMIKATLTDFEDEEAVLDLITRFHIDIDEQMETEILAMLPYVMGANNETLEHVDFNDQCYLPVVNKKLHRLYDKYDFILCDEFQDFNRCNIEFIFMCLAAGGRLIAVGDHHQSLYGFRGADMRAIPDAIKRLNATVLPLSICYRCPKSHIERVRELRPDIEIEAAPDAVEGVRENISYKQMLDKLCSPTPEDLNKSTMIVSRTNAPLVSPAFKVIKTGRKAIIAGGDIGKDLVMFIERFQCDDLNRLDILMQEFTAIEVERWELKNKEMMAEMAMERYQTIREIMRACVTVTDLILKITTLFSDDTDGVIFSSIHRAKGLEAEVIYVMTDNLPHPRAKTDEEKEQEMNCLYVAYTRSLSELYETAGTAKDDHL